MIQNLIFGILFFFFFENIISVSGMQHLHIGPHVSVDIIRVCFFFYFFYFPAESPEVNKSSEKLHSFYEPQLT